MPVQAMRKHRMLQEAVRMATLGFEPWQCLAALTYARGELGPAIECLLRGQLDSPDQVQALLSHSGDGDGNAPGDESHSDQLLQAQVNLPTG